MTSSRASTNTTWGGTCRSTMCVSIRRWRDKLGEGTLELGCGTGRITAGLVRSGLEVTCVDISGGMLREMRREPGTLVRRPRIVQMDIARWSLNARFDS